MTSFKNHSGITLVALVVTIVVLLILAGVSINMVLGNNGLITKAKDAKTKTEQDQVNMETGMNNLYDEMMGILGENGGTGNSDGDGNEGGTGDEGDGDGTGSGGGVDLSTLAIGDLVNYTYDTTDSEGNALTYSLLSTQSGYKDQTVPQSTTTLQWKVLNIDEENGTIDLVSSTSTSNSVYFKGALGYNNGVYLLNDMCAKLYSNSSLGITARSINLVDMEKHLTPDGIVARNAFTGGTTLYGSTYTQTSNIYYPNLYKNQLGQGIDLADGATVTQPDLSGIDPYNESDSYYSTPTTETYTKADSSLTVTQTSYQIEINETNYGEAASVLSQNNSAYWVASRCGGTPFSVNSRFGLRWVSVDMDYAYMFNSDTGSNRGFDRYLRPVVSFASSLLDGTKDASGAWNLVSAE